MQINGKLILIARLKRGWTKTELANRIQKSASTISRLESGKFHSPKVVRDVAEALGLTIEQMLQNGGRHANENRSTSTRQEQKSQ